MLAEQFAEFECENKELIHLRGVTLATFQAFETEKAEDFHKLEYINGRVYAMAGGSEVHNRLSGEMFRLLANHIGKKNPCVAFNSDQKTVKDLERAATKNAKGVSVYPDASVLSKGDDGVLTPLILMEVLSDSTGSKDRKEKLPAYKQIPSVKEILLVNQQSPVVEVYARSGDVFVANTFTEGESFVLESIGLEISVSDLYEGILL